jgi:hypothetical protein
MQIVPHEQLGELRFDGDEGAWRVRVQCPSGPIEFLIGGGREPDGGLLAHASELVSSSAAFMVQIRKYLEQEAARYEPRQDEVRSLRLDKVCLFWPKRPNDGMLYFTNANNDGKVWRCDYVDRKPQSLGFDA